MEKQKYKSLSIMQPTFLPWPGYFAIMLQSDAFVFLDSVQFAKRSWQQRNRVVTSAGTDWVTVPVFSKGARDQLILEVQVDAASEWYKKVIRTIQQNYSKAPFYKDYSDELYAILSKGHTHLLALNQELILWMMNKLGLERPTSNSSNLGLPGTKADLLANICDYYSSEIYVSAVGSKDYIEHSTAFSDRNIEVIYNKYLPQTYKQLYGEFDAYVSTIDLLFNRGPDALGIINAGLK